MLVALWRLVFLFPSASVVTDPDSTWRCGRTLSDGSVSACPLWFRRTCVVITAGLPS